MDIHHLFGKNVRHFRLKQGMTQQELAFRAKLEVAYVSKLERGLKNATLETISAVSIALAIQPSSLFDELGSEAPEPIKGGRKLKITN
ncbi:helix-turn-helix transcriptional regulator [Terrihabitans rhizophilus]|uniref:Helix-turn-helix transcriptional regulator n=1 Tax=Terrihabitans rhizophilus TaxID=3092662 RepID=A0ABU4RSJ1_9HYPH|nr:helix-turn-helix transcriptional regulator [Terrihabitans sp. PJ23]MDX6806610.1 helix-turn-helix transcriptional regulator [Terrihabitans sp. PJ23]